MFSPVYTRYMDSDSHNSLRGVNLGGWLVLEKWMTPSLFAGTEATDEWTFMQTPGAASKINKHRKTFITEDDFLWLSENGIDAVRLPIGYWILQADGPYLQGIEYVDWAYEMAEKYQLKILLDLHGALGSQNGHDHSGKIGKAGWHSSKLSRKRTTDVLVILHDRYKSSPSYWGIELLNEPRIGLFQLRLRRFYKQTSKVLYGNRKVVFHDGFTPRLMTKALRRDRRAVMDVHLYHMTSWLAHVLPAKLFVRWHSRLYEILLLKITQDQPVIVGEWSIVIRQKSLRRLSTKESEILMQRFGRSQIDLYEKYCAAWFYWSYKTEDQGAWSYRYLVEQGVLPKK